MGSVVDYIDCPNCTKECFSDFYYKTGEQYIICDECGYYYSSKLKRNENGKFITKDGTENFVFDNLILETREINNPYGVCFYSYYDGEGNSGSAFLENEDVWNQVLMMLVKDRGKIKELRLKQYVDGIHIDKKIL